MALIEAVRELPMKKVVTYHTPEFEHIPKMMATLIWLWMHTSPIGTKPTVASTLDSSRYVGWTSNNQAWYSRA